jgi:hypothetical protein
MATYPPPNFIEPLSVFNRSNWISSSEALQLNPLTPANYLKYPVAQGTETFDDLISLGTATLNITLQSGTATFDNASGLTQISANQIQLDDVGIVKSSTLTSDNLVFASAGTGTTTSIAYNNLTLSNLTTTNTLTVDNWSGNIQTVNTSANLTHYLNFSDSSGTGYGHPQKNASLSCNPSTGLITATTFAGNASSASAISLTSDNTSGTYFIPFSKTVSSTSTLYVDNITNPFTINPSTGLITATTFSGNLTGTATSATALTLTSDNTNGAYFIPFAKSSAGSGLPLFVDDVTSPFTYNPSTGVLTATSLAGTATSALSVNTVSDNTSGTYYIPFSKTTAGISTNLYLDDTTTALTYNPSTAILTAGTFAGSIQYDNTASAIGSFTSNTLTIVCSGLSIRNFTWTLTGTTNNLVGLTITSSRINGMYSVGILNSGSGAFTINPVLVGSNIKTKYTSVITVPAGGFAVMMIQILSIAGTTYQVVDAYNIA